MILRAALIDDEQHARENLSMLIEEYCPNLEIVGYANDVKSGLEMIASSNPDVLFLDIRMPSGAEGFELLSRVTAPHFMVVFVTAFKDYAIDAFKVNAVDYILKPIDIDELISTVERLEQRFTSFQLHKEEAQDYQSNLERLSSEMMLKSKRITISHAQGIKVVRIEDILYLQAESNCTRLVFKDGSQYLDTRTLKTYDEELKKHAFYRIHRSFIINVEELEEFVRSDGNQVRLRGGIILPVARSSVQSLLALLGEL
jgi:two-component system LytT family response regulator